MPDDDGPGAGYPAECQALMERTMERVADGDIAGAMRLQAQVSACLRRYGLPAQDMPEEYYRLMHRGILAARSGDTAEVERIRGRMEEMEVLEDIEGEVNLPEECKALLRAQQAAEDSGDWRQAILLTRDYSRCLERNGFLELHMPDEFFDLQLQALDAQERGDMAAYQRLIGEVELMMQLHGVKDTDATA